MVDHARAARLAKRITTIVASAIGSEIKDPRLAHVTITDCRVTGDLHDATVFYTVMGESVDAEPDVVGAAAGLAAATGALRSKVGAGTGVRFTPSLRFELDTVPDATRAMDELLARARAQDEMVARAAEEAKPAGDSDPYRHDGDSEADDSEPDEPHDPAVGLTGDERSSGEDRRG
ncbi:30S ribosome-binding factor RbfA [Gordonia liuliyuniae]|uniref:Ribosome-binding factor A n=1 Tax=Gordonia liuliyuniae TaxID=2911517 RepID=A0ABS9IRK4_9ACTN|nr:30S ribosome-binding factor RbfA [Gordonia liuliyuniae]MCF8588186.1 30S ribosome-binding factor RbfA [Gordonia liuliyuniae]